MPTTPSSPIGSAQAELITGRVSIIVASRDARLRPHLMRAVGCRLSHDRRRVTVLLPESGGREVLEDLRDNHQIAVVFSRPSSNLTVQLKGNDATVTPSGPEDKALADSMAKQPWDPSIQSMAAIPDVVKRLQDLGLDAGGMPPEELAALIRMEIPRLGKIVRDSGARVD